MCTEELHLVQLVYRSDGGVSLSTIYIIYNSLTAARQIVKSALQIGC